MPKVILLATAYFLIPVFSLIFTDNSYFLLSKIYGGYVGTLFGLYCVVTLMHAGGDTLLAKAYSQVLVVVLLLTVLYRLPYGLFDRSVYLFNGPIVFGWLMATGVLCSTYLFIMQRKLASIAFIALFVVGTLLSFSRGPIVALIASLPFLFFVKVGMSRVRLLVTFAAAAVGVAVFVVVFNDEVQSSRLSTLSLMLMSGSDLEIGEFFGARSILYEIGYDASIDNLLFGIGGANFPSYARGFGYPHNVHFEVLIEYGVFAAIAHVTLLGVALKKATPLTRVLIIFGIVTVFFSGDLAYIRYVLVFALASFFRFPTAREGGGLSEFGGNLPAAARKSSARRKSNHVRKPSLGT